MKLHPALTLKTHLTMKPKLLLLALPLLLAACSPSSPTSTQPASELTPAQREAQILSSVTQLTFNRDFDRAGEAYFSKDMRWVVFQGVPKGESAYQLYVARIVYVKGFPSGLVVTTRITPPGSRNTCGWFSDDLKTLIFASTAGKDDPDESSPGYQRNSRNYRWAFSKGMEIYRVDNWERLVMTSSPGGYVNLATPAHRLTDNDAYDAECVLSPDGQWIIFCSDRPAAIEGAAPETPSTQPVPRPKQLYAMKLDGTRFVQLTATPGYNGGPFFSPDGRKLVYRSDRAGNDLLQVYTSDIVRDQGGNITALANEQPITSDVNVNWGPYWTPDAKHILYASSKVAHTNYEIFIRRAAPDRPAPSDGAGTRAESRITFSPGADVLPVVSPDGKYLLWSSKRGDDPTTQVYIAKLTLPKAP